MSKQLIHNNGTSIIDLNETINGKHFFRRYFVPPTEDYYVEQDSIKNIIKYIKDLQDKLPANNPINKNILNIYNITDTYFDTELLTEIENLTGLNYQHKKDLYKLSKEFNKYNIVFVDFSRIYQGENSIKLGTFRSFGLYKNKKWIIYNHVRDINYMKIILEGLNIEEKYHCPLLINIVSFDMFIKVGLIGNYWGDVESKWEKEFEINFNKYKHLFL